MPPLLPNIINPDTDEEYVSDDYALLGGVEEEVNGNYNDEEEIEADKEDNEGELSDEQRQSDGEDINDSENSDKVEYVLKEAIDSEESDDDIGEQENGLDLSDNSDDAPETVSFETGKKVVLKKAEVAMLQIAKEKQDAKTKRQNKNNLFKRQKMEKDEKMLKENRLPDALLNDIACSSKCLTASPEQESDENANYYNSSDEEISNEEEEDNVTLRAVTMDDVNKINQTSISDLTKLRQQRYGGKYNIRMSNKNKKAQMEKRKIN